MWHKMVFVIRDAIDWNTMKHLQRRLMEEHKTTFDSGGGAGFYEWELDWSLEGWNVEQIVEFVNTNASSLNYELIERPKCECKELLEGDNKECPCCNPKTEHGWK
jgi:hypothetical protein